MPKRHILIPARLDSTRLPRKLLADIAGKPMIQHVYEQACQCKNIDTITIATDSEEIKAITEAFGAPTIMTSAAHLSGTDRLAEAVKKLQFNEEDLIVNVQGDEPLIPPQNIEQVFANLEQHTNAAIATLCSPTMDAPAILSPNAVKVVFDKNGFAHYFSRAPIPWAQGYLPKDIPNNYTAYIHIGIYGYCCHFLQQYTQLMPAPTEQLEKLEQLRALWHGYQIHVGIANNEHPVGVDTQAGLDQVRALFNKKA